MKQNHKQNLLIVRHVIKEFFVKENLNTYENFVAEDIQIHCPDSWEAIHSSEIENRKNAKKIDQEYVQAFQFRELNIEDTITSLDKVYVRWRGEGIHKGNFFSIPASYRSFSVAGHTIYRINEEDKVEEVWQSWDMLGLLKQIGLSMEFPKISIHDFNKLAKQASLLTTREKECLKQFLHGKTSKETARELFLSFRTIEYYFENIKDKLDCSCKRELYRLARSLERHSLL